MFIGFTYNTRHLGPALNPQSIAEAEFDEPSTIAAIHQAITANGHRCVGIEADHSCYLKLKKLKPKIDLVFNIAEGLSGEIREAQIPAMLEFLGIPYTHSGALAHAVSLNKALTKKIWRFHGLPTPNFALLGPNDDPDVIGLKFPVIVKPNSEGSSKGIYNASLVKTRSQLRRLAAQIQKKFGETLVEEFLPGREFTVTVMGNRADKLGVYTLPIVEQNYKVVPRKYHRLASYEVKWLFEDRLKDATIAYDCPAKISPALESKIRKLCIAAFESIGCRDVARIDLRLDSRDRPRLLEINTLPGMMPDPNVVSYFPVAARAAGMDFTGMISRIINHARARLACPSVATT